MTTYIKSSIVFILMLTATFSAAQIQRETESDTIRTDVIDVVKPYTPSISDAFKVKETPAIGNDQDLEKKDVKYNIFSFPVASTFTPSKGKAAVVDKAPPVKLFDNYATLGVGTYTTVLGEVYLNHALSRSESVGGYISHHSSQGGIKNLRLEEDKFSDSKIKLNYSSQMRDLTYNIFGGYQHQVYNWYGVPDLGLPQTTINQIKPDHVYHDIHLGGDLSFQDTYINSGGILLRRFSDDYGSAENHITAKVKADIPIRDEEISTTLKLEYLGGKFDRAYATNSTAEVKYGNFNIGVSPTYQLKRDDLTVNLGASLFYLNDTEASKSKFYIYPNIDASYRLLDDRVIAYAGVQGDLINNTYQSFVAQNKFLSPTLTVAPTDQQYNAFLGFKGKLSSSLSYNLSGRYIADRNKALFKSHLADLAATSLLNYQFGNAFNVVYDDVNTIAVTAEINVDVNRNFTLGIKANYFNYNMDSQTEAWNLPDFTGSLFLDYQITKQWFAGASLYYVGERKDQQYTMLTPSVTTSTVSLDSYFDANAHVGYHITDRWSAFVRVNNIAGQDAPRWVNYPVQGIQFLAGATYKFDF